MSPALGLAVLLVLIGAQVAHVVARRVPYPFLLLLAAVGLALAELAVRALRTGGPSLGSLHPVADALGIALVVATGLAVTAPRRAVP